MKDELKQRQSEKNPMRDGRPYSKLSPEERVCKHVIVVERSFLGVSKNGAKHQIKTQFLFLKSAQNCKRINFVFFWQLSY